jgi:hypothetical protein
VKTCCRCKADKPATNEFFPKNRCRPDGLARRCFDCDRATRQASALRNRDGNIERARLWYASNADKHNDRCAQWAAENYKTNINYKLRVLLRGRLRSFVSRSKGIRSHELFGCSVDQLRQHLETQFEAGMTWENHGDWHIDHIRPLSSFDLSDPDQIKAASHFSNLQPLWAAENMAKGARWAA